ncbi:MAG: glycosyltransferase family 39 protein [Geobacteraceae bacterium]|nr:glycosyltransferase family 39 protein [Geobacteraceae bacterium]
MIDYQLWGLDPAGYHFVNILLHALNGILVYRLLLQLELSEMPSLLGAIVFVLHPVQVESVAWVSERKNVLSALFFLLALLRYIAYRRASSGHVKNYALSLVFLTCALLSKSAAVVFPLVIICYDLCFRDEKHPLKLVDKLPFLLLALAASILTIMSQAAGVGGGRMGYPGGTPLTTLWTMIPVFISYLRDLVYPLDLSPYYMVPIRKSVDWEVVMSAGLFFSLAGIAVISAKRWPRLFFFLAVYMISLLPVMQIIPLLTLKNDRYLYFPMIGIAGVTALLISVLMQGSIRLRNTVVVISVACCTVLGGITYCQSRNWKDSTTLWQFAIRRDPDNMLAWLMLAKGYTNQGNAKDAVSALTVYQELKSKFGPLRGWEGIGS